MCWRFTERFPSTPMAPSYARKAVSARLGTEPEFRLGSETVDDVRLIVSELATNAVHASPDDFTVVLEVHHGEARVEVADTAQSLPRVQDPSATDIHGRGLLLVAAAAADWGVVTRDGGKTVWATLSLAGDATGHIFCGLRDGPVTPAT
jgi:two-component sensor histidine kinase